MQNQNNITYVKKASGQDVSKIVWAVAYPAIVFFLTIFTIAVFGQYGRTLIAPFSASMWVVGAVSMFVMQSMRKEIISMTLMTIGVYCCTILVLKQAIAITAGASAEMLMASFGQNLGTTVGNTFVGFLQTTLWMTVIGTPVAFLGMEIKRFFQFRRNTSVKKAMERVRGHRNVDTKR